MTLKECYGRMGADYDDVLRRLEREDRIMRFLSRFPEERSYLALSEAFDAGDGEAAFRAAHSLKGVCLNLGLTALYLSSSALTEELREGSDLPAAKPLLTKVSQDYRTAVRSIQELLQA